MALAKTSTTVTQNIVVRRKKEQSGLSKIWDRTASIGDNGLGVADNGMLALNKGVQSLVPMADTLLNEAEAERIESVVTLGLTKKSAEKQLLEAGYTAQEVADMLRPSNK
jgi:hypothetical protein